MPWSIKLSSRIPDDIDDGYGWYEDAQEGLGERDFLQRYEIK